MAKPRKDESSRPRDRHPIAPPGVTPTVVPAAHRGHERGTAWTAWFRPTSPPAFCAVNSAHAQLGIATLLVAHGFGELVICGHFVVDYFAFGVTDCFAESFGGAEFDRYVAEVDERLALESLTPEHAAAILAIGARVGEGYGIAQPETLPLWQGLLPQPRDLDAWERVVFGGPRPLAPSDLLLAHRRSPSAPWLSDAPTPPVLLVTTRRDH